MFDWRLWSFVYAAYSPGALVVLVVDLSLLGLQKRVHSVLWLPYKACNFVSVLCYLLCTWELCK